MGLSAPVFYGLISAQTNPSENTINVVLKPLFDKYGYPTINEDDTFYPCDQFEITYNVELTDGVNFDEIKMLYDTSIFKLFSNSSAFGVERAGGGDFEVLASAPAGVYPFVVEMWGNHTSSSASSGFGTERYMLAKTTLNIEVVEYDPQFVLALAYTIPLGDSSSSGKSSFDKPFTLIIHYEGNGPDHNLGQRAIIDEYLWEGYAQKIPELDAMQQTLASSITVADFFNQTSNIQFIAQGIPKEAKVSQPLLRVDGQNFQSTELPKTFFWETNTNHTYTWTKTLPETNPATSGLSGLIEAWFEWQLCIVFPPSPNQLDLPLTNQTLSQEILQNQLAEQINSRNGTLRVNQFGNTLTALYAHNKPLEKFAQQTNIEKNQTLQTLTPMPLYFNAQEQYAKIQYQLNPTVAKEITAQNFTHALHYNVSMGCSLFGKPTYFEANFTAQYEFFDKLFNATAYTWNPTHQQWNIDNTVSILATFESAFNFTETDISQSEFEEQISDPTALKLAMEDLYDSGPQTFTAMGAIEANLKRTSPLYYNLKIEAQQTPQHKVTLEQTIQINFRDNQPYTLPLNFDSSSPLQVNVTADNTQSTFLFLDAPVELGGLTNVTLYLITKSPPENLNTLPKNQLELKLLKTLNLTSPQEQIHTPAGYDMQNAQQFYQYYTGYSSVFGEVLGFCGQTQISLHKDPSTTTLTPQGQALLYVEATNVWGTTFHQIIPIQPYTKPQWNLPIDEVTLALVGLIVMAILVSFAVYFIKAK